MVSIAVVIPTFNRRDLLERAIESVLFQEAERVALVVVDDASEVDFALLKNRVVGLGHKWIRSAENGGPAVARNTGAAAVDSEWIAFLDSDDEWMPEKLMRQMAWHGENPGSRISQVREEWFRNGSSVKKPKQWEQRGGDIFSDSVERCMIGPSCVMIRRDLWSETGGFDARFRVCEDYELWLRITRSEEVGLISAPALVRKHGGHLDQLSTAVPALDRFRLVALAELLGSGDLSEEQEKTVRSGIRKKAEILAQGAERRGYADRAEFYRSVANGDLTLLDGGPNPVELEDWSG